MKISYKQLQTYFDDKLPTPDALADAFTFHAFEIEGMEKSGDDTILDIKVLPDRASYAKSVDGIAREVSAILGLKRKAGMAVAPALRPEKITASIRAVNEVLGMELPTKEMIGILERMDIVVEQNGDELLLAVPNDRQDLQDWRDIPEEVGRIYGYDRIEPILPRNTTFKPAVEKSFYYGEKIKNILASLGFSEVYTYSLVPKGDYEIEKPLAADKNHLRTNLTDGIVKSLDLNAKNADLLGLDAINIFEVGRVFTKDGEHTSLCIGIKNVKKKLERVNDKIKTVRDELFKAIGAEVAILCTIDDSGGIISLKGKQIGMTNNTDGVLELNLSALIESLPEPKSYDDLKLGPAVSIEYKKFSLYPFIVRDIAVFVPESVQAEEIWTEIADGIKEANAVELLARHSLFDTFKKDGKTSYAFRMVFQAMDRTLTDDEANKIMEKVSTRVKGKGWEVR